MRVDAAPDSVYQTAYARMTNSGAPDYVICRRYKAAGANSFSPWEYVNPPMDPHKEYHTTERYNGKPVYTMAVDFGALPVDTYKIVAHNIANVDCMLPVYGVIPELGMQIPGKSIANGFWNNDIDVLADRANIQVITRNCNDRLKNDGWTAQITLRYTKTTD